MAVGNISHKKFAQIGEMCKNYSRSRGKVTKKFREPFSRNIRGNVPSSRGITRVEIGNLLENFKTDILGAMGSQLDALQAKKRQDEEQAAMSIFCPRCTLLHFDYKSDGCIVGFSTLPCRMYDTMIFF